MSAPLLWVALPNVYSWSRPRPGRGRVRYEGRYAVGREVWAMTVRVAVAEQGWEPPMEAGKAGKPATPARLQVTVRVTNGGKRDLDRVCTAVLDALQGGGAIADDCAVDSLPAERQWLKAVAPRVDVTVARLADVARGMRVTYERGTAAPVAVADERDPSPVPWDGVG